MNKEYNRKKLARELKINATAIGLPSGAAEIFIEKTLDSLEKSLKTKEIITKQDLNRLLIKELRKYNKDLAYVYKIHDKII